MKKVNSVLRIFSTSAVICCLMLCLSSCGKSVTVKINDAGVITEAQAKATMTVEEALENAGIILNEKDELNPSLSDKISENTEIIIKRYAKVTVVNDNHVTAVELVGGTVADALEKAGISPEDALKADAEPDTYLTNGMVITIKDAINVTLIAEGKTTDVSTMKSTVKDFLTEQGITLDSDDEVSPSLGDKIVAGTKITVKRVEYKEETRLETIEYGTQTVESDDLDEGKTRVEKKGVMGEKKVTYKVKYVDSKEHSKEVLKEEIIKEAVDEIVIEGTRKTVPTEKTTASLASNSGADAASTEKSTAESTSSVSTQNDSATVDTSSSGGKTIVSKQAVYDCDG